jgi:enoyl-CoA hydratase/carnithine racemase
MHETPELVRSSPMPGRPEVREVVLASPGNRNALSRDLVMQLIHTFREIGTDEAIHSVVLRSEGRVFCSGADLREAHEFGKDQPAHLLVGLQRQILTLPQPVVAVVEGPARAGGLGILGACDIVIATADATFALTETRFGLTPAVVSMVLTSRLTSRAAVLTFLTGCVLDGRIAQEIGLVTLAVERPETEEALESVLSDLGSALPQGLRETKALLNAPMVAQHDRDGEDIAALSARLFGSPAARSAMSKFLTAGAP